MDERILLEAVVRAGELMLVSGAEVYRVEDTMKVHLNTVATCSATWRSTRPTQLTTMP